MTSHVTTCCMGHPTGRAGVAHTGLAQMPRSAALQRHEDHCNSHRVFLACQPIAGYQCSSDAPQPRKVQQAQGGTTPQGGQHPPASGLMVQSSIIADQGQGGRAHQDVQGSNCNLPHSWTESSAPQAHINLSCLRLPDRGFVDGMGTLTQHPEEKCRSWGEGNAYSVLSLYKIKVVNSISGTAELDGCALMP